MICIACQPKDILTLGNRNERKGKGRRANKLYLFGAHDLNDYSSGMQVRIHHEEYLIKYLAGHFLFCQRLMLATVCLVTILIIQYNQIVTDLVS